MTNEPSITVRRLASASELAELRPAWNALARGVPFRTWEWLESWWRAYGTSGGKELFTLTAVDGQGQLLGLAPWYLERYASQQRVIRFLGSGEVCSDYLTVLCREGHQEEVGRALADWLSVGAETSADCPKWDLLDLGGIYEDKTLARLVEDLAARGNRCHRRTRPSCWRVHLPPRWDDYLAMLSKSHRKQIRRLDRDYFQTGRATLHQVQTDDELRRGLELLEGLHQRRRESLGDRGCFASVPFAAFHRETAQRLLHSGSLRLVSLEVDGRTVAVEYQVLGDGVVYAYQSGIEPEALAHEPGRLITIGTLKQAISEGRQAFDFLRGDESYKAHWRAQPRPTQEIHVVSNRASARLRHNLWMVGGNMKHWLTQSWRLAAGRT